MALGNLIEGKYVEAPSSLAGRAFLARRLGLLHVSHLEFPCSELFSLPPWSWAVQGYPGIGLDGFILLVLGVVLLAYRRGGEWALPFLPMCQSCLDCWPPLNVTCRSTGFKFQGVPPYLRSLKVRS